MNKNEIEKQKSYPKGIKGKLILKSMKEAHNELSSWGLNHIDFNNNCLILDIGCGAGYNINYLLNTYKDIKIIGIDKSNLATKESIKLNKDYIKSNRCIIKNVGIEEVNFEPNSFDKILAFCSLRFFSDLENTLQKIRSFLKDDGEFIICDHARYDKESLIKILEKLGYKVTLNLDKEPNYSLIKCTK